MLTLESIRSRESEMIECLSRGDREGFKFLYDQYAPILLGFLSKMTGSSKEAENILLKTFVVLWQNRASYSQGHESLLRRILLLGRELCMAEKKIPENSSEKENQRPDSPVNADKGKKDDFPAEHESALDLVYFHGYSLKEAATKLNISETMITISLQSAIKKLKSNQYE